MEDEKIYKSDALDIKNIFRIIQSLSNPKAEPIKLWLAQMGKERIDELFNPEIAIKRAIDVYRNRGYSDKWIETKLKQILYNDKYLDDVKTSK